MPSAESWTSRMRSERRSKVSECSLSAKSPKPCCGAEPSCPPPAGRYALLSSGRRVGRRRHRSGKRPPRSSLEEQGAWRNQDSMMRPHTTGDAAAVQRPVTARGILLPSCGPSPSFLRSGAQGGGGGEWSSCLGGLPRTLAIVAH